MPVLGCMAFSMHLCSLMHSALHPPAQQPGPRLQSPCRLAVTLGMLGVLRQLQPAGRNDYLIARVQLPASMVHRAWQAAEVG